MQAIQEKTDHDMLKNHVLGIIETLEKGFDDDDLNQDDEPMTAMDYIFEALDIEYVVSSDKKNCLGARILVSFGGPNIWINTREGIVEGYWWGERFSASYTDKIGFDDAITELFNC